ncbi:hypothetical protein [Streptomyces sp. NPDC058045]|uniref:hypothetical protein n=1 Tax=Streptomyces sp. NPDC058045 TaxID=3346311 RepID=UPI0036E06AE2
MSNFADQLRTRLPDDFVIPEPLERAWSWMEAQGWGSSNSHDYYLTPYAGERQLGVVFSPGLTLDGWFEAGDTGFDRLVPFVDLDGSGSLGVLWSDDRRDIQVGALGGEGQVSLLAENTLDFLRLVAIGYEEVGSYLDGEPEDEEAVEGHAAFRSWVQDEFDVVVPNAWRYADPDPFNAWVSAVKGGEHTTY